MNSMYGHTYVYGTYTSFIIGFECTQYNHLNLHNLILTELIYCTTTIDTLSIVCSYFWNLLFSDKGNNNVTI